MNDAAAIAVRRLVALAAEQGAEHAHARVETVHSVATTLDHTGSLAECSGTSTTHELDVVVDGKAGCVVVSAPVRAEQVVQLALHSAMSRRASTPDRWTERAELAIQAGEHGALCSPERRSALVRAAIGTPPDAAVLGAEHVEEHRAVAVASIEGLDARWRQTRRSLWHWIDGPGGQHLEGSVAWGDRMPDPSMLRHAREELLAARAPGAAAAAGRMPVLLAPAVAIQVVNALSGLLSGVTATRRLVALQDKVGRRIASSAVTLVDDGCVGAGPFGAPIDDEGVPTRCNVLLEAGVLRAFLHTRESAAECGIEPNGCAVRPQHCDATRPGPRGLRLMAGVDSPDRLRDVLGDGFEAVAVARPAQVTGLRAQFSIDVFGWEIRDGRRTRTLGPVRLSCGLFAWLREVRACGEDLAHSALLTGLAAPSVLVGSIELGAA